MYSEKSRSGKGVIRMEMKTIHLRNWKLTLV